MHSALIAFDICTPADSRSRFPVTSVCACTLLACVSVCWYDSTLVTSVYVATLYIKDRKNILKMNKEVGMLLPKKEKRANTSGVGKINNYCEDIYIHVPPYNNTH